MQRWMGWFEKPNQTSRGCVVDLGGSLGGGRSLLGLGRRGGLLGGGRLLGRGLGGHGLGLLAGLLLGQQNGVDVGQHTSRGDGHSAEQLVELLIVADGQLDVAGGDALKEQKEQRESESVKAIDIEKQP